MVKKAALKTAGISMAGFQPRPKVFDGQTPAAENAQATVSSGVPPSPARSAATPFTGVGSVMAAITREADLSHELSQTRTQLAEAQSRLDTLSLQDLVENLPPQAIARSRWANRIEAEFASVEFTQLKDEIASAGGNVQPIKVRRIAGAPSVFDGQTPVYEIVFGHRRHRACLELGLPVQAIVVEGMDDKALFEAMDRENRSRKNLSAWEQGRMYDEALRQGLYPSLRRLSEGLGVNLSDASRAVQLARLPEEIVQAFASPLELQVRWAKPLADALQRDPDGVLGRARSLRAENGHLAAMEVVDRLTGKTKPALPKEMSISVGKRVVATLRGDAAGKTHLIFEAQVLPPSRHAELARLLKEFLTAGAAQ